jgi:hypothetical protein
MMKWSGKHGPPSYWRSDNRFEHHWVGLGHDRPVPTEASQPPFPGARELQRLPQ